MFSITKQTSFFIFPLPWGAKPFPGLRPRQGRQNSIYSSLTLLFRKFRSFSASCPKLSSLGKIAQTIESTQRVYRWIAFTLMKGGKLLPSETNTQILRNLDFCDPTARKFSLPIFVKFAQCNNITLRAEGLYESSGSRTKAMSTNEKTPRVAA